uniref:Uncharacterized protein n=1 Tax=Ciona intestinalis TaxID=7719 RepID=H2XRJ6_CIOIN
MCPWARHLTEIALIEWSLMSNVLTKLQAIHKKIITH